MTCIYYTLYFNDNCIWSHQLLSKQGSNSHRNSITRSAPLPQSGFPGPRNLQSSNPSSERVSSQRFQDVLEDDLLRQGFGSYASTSDQVRNQDSSPSSSRFLEPSINNRNPLSGRDGGVLPEDSLTSVDEEDLDQTLVEEADYQDEQAASRRRSGSVGMQHQVHVKERDGKYTKF